MSSTKIPYVDYSWNIFAGCSKKSKGCLNCFAERMACRLMYMGQSQYLNVIGNGGWNGKIIFRPEFLEKPLHWKKPRKVFVNSMSDTFHANAKDEQIDEVMAVIALCPQHEFLIFTKRYERMWEYFTDKNRNAYIAEAINKQKNGNYQNGDDIFLPLENLTLVHSYCTQEDLEEGLSFLLKTPAAKRIISFEPLVEKINFETLDCSIGGLLCEKTSCVGCECSYRSVPVQIDGIIIGGESIGSHAGREMKIEWVESLVEQADSAGIPVYIKQLHIGGKLVRDIEQFPKHLQRREF